MQAENAVALREWTAVCDRVGTGEQILLLRTGGIHEQAFAGRTRGSEHREFWLLPTRFHEAAERLVESARDRFSAVSAAAPVQGIAFVDIYATVSDALFVEDPARVSALASFHIYDPDYVRRRFEFRAPGLWALIVRAHRVPRAFARALGPEHAGCVSWVHLPPPLATTGVVPVIDDHAFAERRTRVLAALGQEPT